jgi:glycopeptide antibiotics resistance protein
MNRRRIGQIGAILSILLYASAMMMPRRLLKEDLDTTNFLKQIFHQILYYGGSLEPAANFILLMPVFASLIYLLGRSKALAVLTICLALSATVEFLQRFIPGRVSSVQDLILNCLGALFAFLLYKIALKASLLR